MAAVDSAGLTTDTDAIVHTIGAVLEEWPHQDRVVMASFPAMTVMRRAVLLACIGDIACFRDDRQLRKLLGWYPEARESGSSLSKHRLGRSGNRLARRELWLSTLELLSPSRDATPFRDYYRRLRERGMAGQVAMGHLAGKLISVLFYCPRRGAPYDPRRHARDLGIADACGGGEAPDLSSHGGAATSSLAGELDRGSDDA